MLQLSTHPYTSLAEAGSAAGRPALRGTVALASGCLLAPCPFTSSWTPRGMTSTEAGCILLLRTASPHRGSKRSSSKQSPPFRNGLSLEDVAHVPTLSLSSPHRECPHPSPASRPSPMASFSEIPSPAHTRATACCLAGFCPAAEQPVISLSPPHGRPPEGKDCVSSSDTAARATRGHAHSRTCRGLLLGCPSLILWSLWFVTFVPAITVP